jgi:hypothetical protein
MKYLYHYILFFTIVIIFAYINSSNNKETFTTYVRQMYRPYVRHARVVSEGFYETQKNSVNNLFRKFGIM